MDAVRRRFRSSEERPPLTVPTAQDLERRLKDAQIRPTRQRLGLAGLLFSQGDRHVSADDLYAEARGAGIDVSLATVYNTLNQFTDAGLLREVVVEAGRSYFDTNVDDHHHLFHETSGRLTDIPLHSVEVAALPDLPSGLRLKRVDVILRVTEADE